MIIIQDVMRINSNEVFNFEMWLPPNEDSEYDNLSTSMAFLKETNQKGFSNIRQKLIEMNVLSKGEITSMYHISKTRPEVEELKLIPEVTPKIISSDPTTNK